MYREDSWVISSGILNRDVFAWMLLWHLFEQTLYLKLLVYATHDLQAPKIEIEISNWGKKKIEKYFFTFRRKTKTLFPDSLSVFFGGEIDFLRRVWAISTALSNFLFPYETAQGWRFNLNNQALFFSSRNNSPSREMG